MSSFAKNLEDFRSRLSSLFSTRDPLRTAIGNAQVRLLRASDNGRALTNDIIDPIIALTHKSNKETITDQEERDFFIAYGKLNKKISDIRDAGDGFSTQPFENAVDDSEQLLAHAAAVGVSVSNDIVKGILDARTALNDDTITGEIRTAFYAAYTKLSSLFGDVSAESVRNSSSNRTHNYLRILSACALITTFIVATMSIYTFTTDQTSKKISEQIKLGNEQAAKLRAGLFVSDSKTPSTPNIEQKYIKDDPCGQLLDNPGESEKTVRSAEDVETLQAFSSNIRDIRSNGIKLNSVNRYFPIDYNECDPFDKCIGPTGTRAKPSDDDTRKMLELQPTIVNYTAEALCKIRTFQDIRSFATNVNANYTAIIGALLSYALPILYSLLGALAFQLRYFSDAIHKKTYQPSFSDSARIITAVIAGAIAGLFNPAKSLEISPLATAFLIGYGVEVFFKFLDSLMNAFGSGAASTPRAGK